MTSLTDKKLELERVAINGREALPDELVVNLSQAEEILGRQAEVAVVGGDRKGWTAFAIVDPSSNNYTYDGFFMTKKQAVEVLRNRYQGIKGIAIIKVDVYPTLTPPTNT